MEPLEANGVSFASHVFFPKGCCSDHTHLLVSLPLLPLPSPGLCTELLAGCPAAQRRADAEARAAIEAEPSGLGPKECGKGADWAGSGPAPGGSVVRGEHFVELSGEDQRSTTCQKGILLYFPDTPCPHRNQPIVDKCDTHGVAGCMYILQYAVYIYIFIYIYIYYVYICKDIDICFVALLI